MTTPNKLNDALRPATLDEVVGQAEVVDALRVMLAGAAARGGLPPHLLLAGPAGTGKTTLALCVAHAIGGRLVSLIGPSVKRVADVLPVLIGARKRDTIFIDEIHRVWRPTQEYLFPVMEDGKLVDDGPVINLPPMLFIGATTDPERLLTPMLDRMTVLQLRLYRPDELVQIVERAAGKLGVTVSPEAADVIARAAEGVPRVALKILKASRDYAYAMEPGIGTVKSAVVTLLGGRTQNLTDARVHLGGLTIGPEAVHKALSSPAFIWRSEGRDAG